MNDRAVLLVSAVAMLMLAIAAIVLAVAVGLGAAILAGVTFTGAS
jgi:hypothetical protein